jgi:hypothetical protein
MANIVIFSKNRAMQLDLLLRSFKQYFKEWEQVNKTVIYMATTSEFVAAYDIVKQEHPEFKFVDQGVFKTDVLESVDPKQQFTMFLVDDIIFKKSFSASDPVFGILKNNNQMISLSLRLHPGIHYCYAINKSTARPPFVRHGASHYRVWRWPGMDGDWGYGISLDGDIFNTSFIAPLLLSTEYSNPNQLEAVLNDPRIIKGVWPTYKCCYDSASKLLNNPANRVQDEFKNRAEMSYDTNDLNKLFLDGKRISLDEIENIDNGAVHYPLEYKIV